MGMLNDNGTVVMTDEHTKLFHYMQLIHGLALEINTGMRLSNRGSVMNAAKRVSGSGKGTKKGVLFDMVVFTMGEFPIYHPPVKVLDAIGRKYLKTTAKELAWLKDTQSAGTPIGNMWAEKVTLELHMLGAILPDMEELSKENPAHTFRVQAITDDMIRLAAN